MGISSEQQTRVLFRSRSNVDTSESLLYLPNQVGVRKWIAYN